MEALLGELLPRLLAADCTFRLHQMGGKQSLLKHVEARLRGYAAWIPDNYLVIVVVDEDRQDCTVLKEAIGRAITASGLTYKSTVEAGHPFQCAVRVAVEELEAWLFGDCDALRAVFPRLPASLEERAQFRDPDRVAGGTWEALERVLQRAGYYQGGMPKVEVATLVGPHMNVMTNRSKSFQVFRDLLISL